MTPPEKWLVAAVAFVVIEILPPATHFGALCFAFGALAAAIAAAFFSASWLPWAAFVICTIALFPILVPLAKFLFGSKRGPSSGGSGDEAGTR